MFETQLDLTLIDKDPFLRIDYNFFEGNERGLQTTIREVNATIWAAGDLAANVSTNVSRSFDTLNSTRPKACAYLNYRLNSTDYYRGRNNVRYNITEAATSNWRTIGEDYLGSIEGMMALYAKQDAIPT